MSTLPVVNTEALRVLLEAFIQVEVERGASSNTTGAYRAVFRELRAFADTCPREAPTPEPRPVLPEDTFTKMDLERFVQHAERTLSVSTANSIRQTVRALGKWLVDQEESVYVDAPSTVPDGEEPTPLRLLHGTPEAMAATAKEGGGMNAAEAVAVEAARQKLMQALEHQHRARSAQEASQELIEEAADLLAGSEGAAREVKRDLLTLYTRTGEACAEMDSHGAWLKDTADRLKGGRHG